IGPPRPIVLEAASFVEVIDGFFHLLRGRERRMLEMRYGPLDGGGATLAEIGAEFGLTRERVRQILHVSLQRIASDGERRRRLALTEFVRAVIERVGGLIRERDLVAELRNRLLPPYVEAGPFVRTLLEAETGWVPAGHGVWASAEVSLVVVAALRESFRRVL